MITVCGEALVDLVSTDARRFTAHAGGSPANVAVGLGRLGVPVSLLARISRDSFGALLRRHLTESGVDLRNVVVAAEPTTLAVATPGPDGSASYEFYLSGTADWQWTRTELPDRLADGVVALHAGSMALDIPPGANEIAALMERERRRGAVTISYDPNIRRDSAGSRSATLSRVERLVPLCDVVKVSAEDLAWLMPDEPPVGVARAWVGLGPALVVVTLGAEGSVGVTGGAAPVRVRAPSTTVVDTIGAGDAYMAGLLEGLHAARLLGAEARSRMSDLVTDAIAGLLHRAGVVATLTCRRSGAQPPTRADVLAWPE